MSGEFDPYYRWLSIPPQEQPPSLYRLLGLADYESNHDVIDSAADRQLAHVRSHQSGKHADLSQTLLNEIAAARLTLLDPAKKAEYDAELRRRSQETSPNTAPGIAIEIDTRPAIEVASPSASAQSRRAPTASLALVIGGAIAALLVVVGGLVLLVGGSRESQPVAENAPLEANRPDRAIDVETAAAPPQDAAADYSANAPIAIGAEPPAADPRVDAPHDEANASEVERSSTASSAAPGADSRELPKAATASATTTSPRAKPAQAEPPPRESQDKRVSAPPAEAPGGAASTTTDARLLVPSEAERAQHDKQIRELFPVDKARNFEERMAVAQELLDAGKKIENDEVAQFVLFDLARDTSNAAGNVRIAFTAIDELNRLFQVDDVSLRIESIKESAQAAAPAAIRTELVNAGIELTDQLLRDDRYVEAAGLIRVLQAVARKNRDGEQNAALLARQRLGSELYQGYKSAKKAIETLNESPGDHAAALAAGRFYALFKGDWRRGLPLLSQGSDQQLQQIARQEMEPPTASDEILKLADAWWDRSAEAKGRTAKLQRARAKMWYQQAVAGLSGLSKLQAERRIAELKDLDVDGGAPLSAVNANNPTATKTSSARLPDSLAKIEATEPASAVDAADDTLPQGAVLRLGSRRFFHPGGIEDLKVSSDGKYVVSIRDGGIRVWDVSMGIQVAKIDSLPRQRADYDGDRLALIAAPREIGVDGQEFRVVDLPTGEELSSFRHKTFSASISLSRGGQVAAILNADRRSVSLVDPKSGAVLDELVRDGNANISTLASVSFSSSGAVIALQDRAVQFYEVTSEYRFGKALANIQNEQHSKLAIAPDGKTAALSQNRYTTIWSVQTGEQLKRLDHPAQYSVLSPVFSPDGRNLAMFMFDHRILFWDVASGRLSGQIPTGTRIVGKLDYSPDGRRLVGGSGGQILFWDVASGKQEDFDPTRDMSGAAEAVTISPDGRRVATADRVGYVTLWSQANRWSGEALPNDGGGRFDPWPNANFLQFIDGGKRLLAGSCKRRNSINMWDAASKRPIGQITGHAWPVTGIHVHEKSGLVASTSRDNTIRIWSDKGAQLQKIDEEGGCLDFSPDGSVLAVAGARGGDRERQPLVRLFDPRSGALIKSLQGHSRMTLGVSFSPDGTRLVSSAADGAIRIWDVDTGACQTTISVSEDSSEGHRQVAFSPTGEMIASTGNDGKVYLWSAATGEELAALHGHDGQVKCLAWRADGKQLVSGGADASAVVWDVEKASAK